MKLEVGKYYRTRDGRKVGPITFVSKNGVAYWDYRHDGEICCYSNGGIKYFGEQCGGDLVAEWVDEPEPKLWRDMTPEEKGALLLAHHEGKVIEGTSNELHGVWTSCPIPAWHHDSAYRIKPEPKRETVTLFWGFDATANPHRCVADTHRITFDLIDGEPDCDSIKMEKL